MVLVVLKKLNDDGHITNPVSRMKDSNSLKLSKVMTYSKRAMAVGFSAVSLI